MQTGQVFVSHTSDMAQFPAGRSFVQAALDAVSRAGLAPVDMRYFAARDGQPFDYCRARVRECEVYVAVVGFRHGSVVPGQAVSYTELEFNEAGAAGIPRLVFLLDDAAGLPAMLADGDRGLVEGFRQRLSDAGLMVRSFASADGLELEVFHAVTELTFSGWSLSGQATRDVRGAAGQPAGHVFISYVREDARQVDLLQRALEAGEVSVWRDTARLWPGEDWRLKVRQAITGNALVFIACFSRQSTARVTSYQNEELALAIDQLRRRRPDVPWLIPVRFDDCRVPDLEIGGGRTLASIQRADLFGERRDEEMTRLLIAVQGLLGQRPSELGSSSDTRGHQGPSSGVLSRITLAAPGLTQERAVAETGLEDRGARHAPSGQHAAADEASRVLTAHGASLVTTETTVQRLKQALADPTRRVEVSDLVDREIQQLASRITDTTRHPLGGVPFADQRAAYEQESATSACLLATGVFYGDEIHTSLWIRSLRRLLSARRPFTSGSYNAPTEAMRHYPALLCLWAMGISAILADRGTLLAHLLLEPTWTPIFGQPKPQPAVQCLNPNRIVTADNAAPGGMRWLYPQSHHIRVASRGTLSHIEPDDDLYQEACDRLEYLASLVAMDIAAPNGHPWAGEFILRDRYHNQDPNLSKFLEGGAFGSDTGRSQTAREALITWIMEHPRF